VSDELPLPPVELARRVGVLDQDDPVRSFDAMGAHLRETVLKLQGEDWFAGGRRVLDFGCGSGKLLRHFASDAEDCEFIGCDIDEPSIAWLQQHYSPPLQVFVCNEQPGLPLPDDHIDLAVAISVFTHLTTHWAGWLLEIHRVLRPGARFVCTFLGRGMSEAVAKEPWNEDRIGMNVLQAWQPWDHGGPSVQHSEWWLRAHWGRAFEFERVEDSDEFGHGLMVLRKREVHVTEEDLRTPEPGELREYAALAHNVEQLTSEMVALGSDRETVTSELDAVRADRELVKAELDAVRVDRELLKADRERVVAELDAARVQREQIMIQLDVVRAERQELARQREVSARVSELEAQIAAMRSTAAWRWASRYWRLRAHLRSR
jgi:SAM-dependent methyltransferase